MGQLMRLDKKSIMYRYIYIYLWITILITTSAISISSKHFIINVFISWFNKTCFMNKCYSNQANTKNTKFYKE